MSILQKIRMVSRPLGALLIVIFVLLSPRAVFAAENEIHYQSIESVRSDIAIVADHSPGGDTRYACKIKDGSCKKIAAGVTLNPAIRGATDYLTSSQGRYGVSQQSFPINGQTMTLFTLFDVTSDTPKSVGVLSAVGTIIKRTFSPDENVFVVVTEGGVVTVYDIAQKKSRVMRIAQTELPFFNVSYAGTYLSAYSYVGGVHRIWNTKTGALTEIAGAPSYVEFSASEHEAAFGVDNSGFKNLSVATGFASGSAQTTPVASGAFLVEDYIYVGEELYYLANKKSPLAWDIYRRGEAASIAIGASYSNYLKRVGGMLAYIKNEGKNANVYLYDKDARKHVRLDAAPESSAASNITRSEITIAERTAVLLSPKNTSSRNERKRNLFLWLHGGPQRQTSLGYHPYLSYAVYDELLERLAAGGNYVLKLDYSGSWGYGQDFIETLDRQVGVVEIADVRNAIAAFKEKYNINNVYLVGNSYGGYMAFRAINEMPDLIDGVVSINGVADWYTLISIIPSSPFRELFDGVPNPQNLPLYLSASVFSQVDKIDEKTPLLIFYATADTTVPTAQSIQYDAVMRARNKNATLVALAGEAHVLKKRSTLTKLCETIADELSLKNIVCR